MDGGMPRMQYPESFQQDRTPLAEFQMTTQAAWLGIRETQPRGGMEEQQAGEGRVGGPTQHHAQGSKEHPSVTEKCPLKKSQNQYPPWMKTEFVESHTERKFAEESCIFLGRFGWEVGDTDFFYDR